MVSPTQNLLAITAKEGFVPASSLLMCMRQEDMDKSHFFKSVPSLSVSSAIKECIESDVSDLKHTYDVQILNTMAKMLSCKQTLHDQSIMNEAEVRYEACLSMLTLVCQCFESSLRLVEPIRNNWLESSSGEAMIWAFENVPIMPSAASKCEGHSIESAISPRSKVDYFLYTMINKGNRAIYLVIALIEEKHTSTEHSIAQAIGYYSSSVVPDKSKALVIVLSATEFHLVVFPIVDGKEKPLINAVSLGPFSLWKDEYEVDIASIRLFLAVIRENSCLRKYTTKAEDAGIPEQFCVEKHRINVGTYTTEIERLEEQLKKQTKEVKEEQAELKKQLKKLEAAIMEAEEKK